MNTLTTIFGHDKQDGNAMLKSVTPGAEAGRICRGFNPLGVGVALRATVRAQKWGPGCDSARGIGPKR